MAILCSMGGDVEVSGGVAASRPSGLAVVVNRIGTVLLLSFLFSCSFLDATAWGAPDTQKKQYVSDPQRVISLSPIITETIYLVGAQDKLVGNTTYCNVPAEAMEKEKIGSVTQMNVEKIIRLKPDLVIASALSKEKQLMMLEKMKIKILRAKNPKTFDEMCDITLTIGERLGHKRQAEVVVGMARKEARRILALSKDLEKPRVFMQIGLKPLHSVNKEMFINEYIRYTGGINIAENESSGIYSREKVLSENPDVILVATMGSSKKAGEVEKERWMDFKGLKAAENQRVHVLDPEMICSPTPVTFVKGIKALLPLIHREIPLAGIQRVLGMDSKSVPEFGGGY